MTVVEVLTPETAGERRLARKGQAERKADDQGRNDQGMGRPPKRSSPRFVPGNRLSAQVVGLLSESGPWAAAAQPLPMRSISTLPSPRSDRSCCPIIFSTPCWPVRLRRCLPQPPVAAVVALGPDGMAANWRADRLLCAGADLEFIRPVCAPAAGLERKTARCENKMGPQISPRQAAGPVA